MEVSANIQSILTTTVEQRGKGRLVAKLSVRARDRPSEKVLSKAPSGSKNALAKPPARSSFGANGSALDNAVQLHGMKTYRMNAHCKVPSF